MEFISCTIRNHLCMFLCVFREGIRESEYAGRRRNGKERTVWGLGIKFLSFSSSSLTHANSLIFILSPTHSFSLNKKNKQIKKHTSPFQGLKPNTLHRRLLLLHKRVLALCYCLGTLNLEIYVCTGCE